MTSLQPGGVEVLDRKYAGTTNTLHAARNDVVSWLRGHRIDPDLQERTALVLSELATNAIQAGPGNAYSMRVSLGDDHSVVVAVTSQSEHDRPTLREHWSPANPLAARGRGLLIVSELSDRVEVGQPAPDVVVVTAVLH